MSERVDPVVLTTVSNKVATVTINRPEKLNAINKAVIDQFGAALDELEVDDEVHVVVVTGSGKNFSAGYDISKSSVVAAPDSAGAHTYLSLEAALTMKIWAFRSPRSLR